MLDKKELPSALEDTQVDVNPYEVTDKIWALIEDYFKNKYDVELSEAYPSKIVTRPTIVCLVQNRTPGRQGSKIHGKGSNFLKFLKTSPDGYVHELHVQQQELTIEYSIYTVSTAEVKRIAWDLERAVLETVGVLQNEIEGFQLYFEQQTMDSSMLWKQQDELVKRTIKFRALLPVKFVKLVPELRFIEKIESWGSQGINGTVFTRTSSDKNFLIPTVSGQIVTNINFVYVQDTEYPYNWDALERGTDWFMRKNDQQSMYLEWNDEYGKVPTTGQTFRVDYNVARRTIQSNVNFSNRRYGLESSD